MTWLYDFDYSSSGWGGGRATEEKADGLGSPGLAAPPASTFCSRTGEGEDQCARAASSARRPLRFYNRKIFSNIVQGEIHETMTKYIQERGGPLSTDQYKRHLKPFYTEFGYYVRLREYTKQLWTSKEYQEAMLPLFRLKERGSAESHSRTPPAEMNYSE
ncbi:unnamed protein product [Amoebophrya sp. A120]|nr:unnamed protein product [Amoebophrya sp. A120]|eukprot:GSA120T00010518001.1